MTARLAIVGGGKMGEALLTGLLGAQWARADEIVMVEALEARRKELAATYVDVDIAAEPLECEAAIIAVKPNGTQLFIGFYDRRLDSANSLIDTFGAVANIDTSSHSVSFQLCQPNRPVIE